MSAGNLAMLGRAHHTRILGHCKAAGHSALSRLELHSDAAKPVVLDGTVVLIRRSWRVFGENPANGRSHFLTSPPKSAKPFSAEVRKCQDGSQRPYSPDPTNWP